ncbi:MAG TPA: nitroreductase family protein [Stellaceae bacterium]|nr:nitroreductase family protein [Stellaceae bacterium]
MTSPNSRTSAFPIHPMFLERWSPRAFADDTIDEHELLTLFEAARWAPSAFNAQPWHFIYGRRGTPAFDRLLGVLIEFNRGWAHRAAALVIVVSEIAPGPDKSVPSHSHSFDAGAAWAYLALQAHRSGWHAHGMTGVDFAKAAADLGVPDTHRVEAAAAIGRIGHRSVLPEKLQAREQPNDRKPLTEIVSEGRFVAKPGHG